MLTRVALPWLHYTEYLAPTAFPFSHFWNLMLTMSRFLAASWGE